MMKRSIAGVAAGLFGLLSSSVALAEITAKDLNVNGDGLLTVDSRTGLEWLDIPVTTRLSYNDIMADKGGWLSKGFRYATGAELNGLFQSAGLETPDYARFPELKYEFFSRDDSKGKAFSLLQMLGPTITDSISNSGPYALFLAGLVADTYQLGGDTPIAQQYLTFDSNKVYYHYHLGGQIFRDVQDPDIGSFLVRAVAPVPEADTYAMMLAGLGVVAISAKRKRAAR